jgi:hypothetical protein
MDFANIDVGYKDGDIETVEGDHYNRKVPVYADPVKEFLPKIHQ